MAKAGRKLEPLEKSARKKAFLAAFEELGTIKHAAATVPIDPSRHTEWMKLDPAYKEAFEKVKELAADSLVREARRRAVDGWEEPVFQKGIQVGVTRKYSDILLMFLLKGARPHVYRDANHQHHHAHDHKHKLTAAEQQRMERMDKVVAQLEAKDAQPCGNEEIIIEGGPEDSPTRALVRLGGNGASNKQGSSH